MGFSVSSVRINTKRGKRGVGEQYAMVADEALRVQMSELCEGMVFWMSDKPMRRNTVLVRLEGRVVSCEFVQSLDVQE